MTKKEKLFLIDGNSYCYRAFYAIKELRNSKGKPTNAVYGFILMLKKLLEKEKPAYLAVAFDMKGPTFRHEQFEDYKIHRKPMPDDLVSQMGLIKETVSAYNVPIFEKQGFEADDILATIAKKASQQGIDVYIVTGDKDMLQMVDKFIKVYSTHKDDLIYDSQAVAERFSGLGPENITDFIALAGDATDNIPGVRGIGEKTAVELIKEFGSLDNLYKNLDKIKSEPRKKMLSEQEDNARMSKELATVDSDVPIEIDARVMAVKGPDSEKLLEIFENAKKNKKSEYDALVPISGGKDSSYILHLAVNIYKLKVLTMTYDNGLFNQIALENIERAIKKTRVDHVFRKPDKTVLMKIYRTMLLESGDICGACDIGTKVNIFKVAQDYSVPIILYGTSPLEEDSFVSDSIQDVARLKYILKKAKDLSPKEVDDFLIYPDLNHFKISYYKKTGKFAKEIAPLFYIDNPTDKEMGEIIAKELDWIEDDNREYSKHFDCIAEPLTNYIRNKIYGYERRLCQYSYMIRRNEINREKALELYSADNISVKPENYQNVLTHLNLTENDLDKISMIPPLKFEKHISKMNILFSGLMKIKQRINNR